MGSRLGPLCDDTVALQRQHLGCNRLNPNNITRGIDASNHMEERMAEALSDNFMLYREGERERERERESILHAIE